MIKNYNCLSNGRDTWLKNDVGDFSTPLVKNSSLTSRTTWLFKMLMLVALLAGSLSNAQCIIGTGTANTNASTIDPVERYYNYEHFQIVYTAAELSAGGMSAGSTISALGFSITQSAVSLANFTISMGLTSQATASPYISTGLTVVKPAFTYAPVVQAAGSFDMITFSTPFIWDGSSNIVVDTCTGSNPFTSPYGGLRYTTGATNSVGYSRTDGSTNCGVASASFDVIRPNIRFNFAAGVACSGTPVAGTASPASATFCSGTAPSSISVSGATAATGLAYQWEESDDNGVSDAYANAVGGTGANTTSYTPPVFSGIRYYRLRVTCTGSGLSAVSTTSLQTSTNCDFNVTRTSGITYNSIASSGTGLTGFTSIDDSSSSATNIGFNFFYKGNTFTQFVANTNGFLALGASTSSSYTNSLSGATNLIAPFWDDLYVTGLTTSQASLIGTYIKYQLTGSAPNRVLTVEWIGMEQFNYPGPNLNFQVKLYETSNKIELIHGSMELFNGTTSNNSTNPYSYSLGITGPSGSGTIRTLAQLGENSNAFGATDPTTLAVAPECNVRYSFDAAASYTGPATFAYAAPANDNVAGAFPLSVNALPCTNLCGTYYTTGSATASPQPSSCTVAPDDDVWFTFVAPLSGQVTVSVKGATSFDAVVSITDSSFTTVTGFGCVNATSGTYYGQTETLNPTGLTAGSTYYIRVSHNGTGFGSRSGFSICVNDSFIPPPTNDNPCGAVTLSTSTACTPYSDTSANSTTNVISATTTTSNGVLAPTCTGAGTTVNDVWFKFTATSTTHGVTVTPVAGFDVALEGFSMTGTCAGSNLTLTSVGCVNGAAAGAAEQVVFTTTVGQDYYLRIYRHPSGFSGAPINNSQFSICITNPVPACTTNSTPANLATNVSITPTLTWSAATYATNYDIYLGTTSGPTTFLANVVGATTYTLTGAQALLGFTQYYWYVVPKNLNGSATCGAANQTSFTTGNSCIVPTNPTTTGLTTTTATVSWTAPISAPANGYQYEIRTSGAAGSGATGLTATGSTIAGDTDDIVTGLTPSTTYTLYVRGYCGGTSYSDWTAGYAFTTLCSVSPIPLTEGFNATTIPTCWTTQVVAVQTATAITFVATGDFPTTSPQEGSNMVKYASFTTAATNGAEERLRSKPLTTTGYSSIDVNFYWRNDNNTSYNAGQYLSEGVQVQYSVNGGTTWTDAGSFIPRHDGTLAEGTAQWNLKKVTISGAANQANVIIGFKFHSGYGDNCYLDNVSIIGSPPTVASFTPSTICNGGTNTERTITVTGTLFTGATAVKVNGVNVQSYIVNSDTQITAIVSSTNTSGPVSVTIPNGTGTSTNSLTINTSPTVAVVNGPSFVCLPNTNTITLTDSTPTGVWSSSDVDVATVSASGVVTPVSSGNAIISYTVTDTGCATTQTHAVAVNNPVVISSSTATQTVVTGGNTFFTASASGTPSGALPGLTYQWEVSTDGDNFTALSDGGVYSGTNTATLTLTSVPASLDQTLYHVIVTGACNAATSDLAVLIVGETGIDTQPASVAICNSGPGTATFTVVASGDVTTYQWQEDQGGDNWMDLTDGGMYSGANTATLSLTGLTLSNSGWKYRCFVTGISSATSNPATLTVVPAATINTQPVAQTICYSGGSANFSVSATGGISSYQWQYSANGGTTWTNVANGTPTGASYTGSLTASLSVNTTSAIPASGNYSYRAIVNSTAPCANATSNSAQLLINTPLISSQPTASSVVVGSTATFTVATTSGSPTYQWQYATTVGGPYTNVVNATPAGVTYTGATTATLSVVTSGTTVASTARFYRAIVSSPVGCSVNSNGAQLTIVDYCATSYPSGVSGDEITNVTLGTLNNNSGASASPYYTYFNSVAAPSITQLTTASVSIKFGSDSNQYAAVWIDFNKNGVFEASEGAISGNGGSLGTVVINLPVPLNAVPGVTRMRVRGGNDSVLTTAQACGVSSSNYGETEDYNVNIVAAQQCANPIAGTATSNVSNVCVSGTATLTATGYSTGEVGLSTQWYNSAGAISGATSATYTTPVLTSPESYYFKVSCSNSGLSANSNTVTIGVNNPNVVSTTPATRCGAGAVTLQATGSAGTTINWYTSATGGTSVYTGANYSVPNLDNTTTYYAEANIGGTSGNAGVTGNATSTNGTGTTYYGILFNTTQPNVRINSVDIPFTGTGTFTIAVKDTAAGTTFSSVTTTTVTGNGLTPVQVPLGLTVSAAGNYSLILTAVSGTIGNLGYKSGTYPSSALSGSFNVTNGYYFGSTTTNYYFFNLNVSNGCNSGRVAVTATVNPAPSLTISNATATICSGNSTGTVTITSPMANFDSYTWSPATGVSGNTASGYTFTPTVSTVYTLTGNQTGGGQCQNTATYNVTVNQSPTAIAITPSSAALCSNGSAVQLTASGGIVPLNAVPILSENFNASAPSWTITNGGSSPAVSNFVYQTSPYTYSFNTFSTANGGKFAMANADAGGSGSTTDTKLTSPTFSTVGYTSATLSFEHFYNSYSADVTVALEISTNGGSTWSTLVDYKGTTVGSASSPAPASVSLAAYLGQSNVKIRYNYVSGWGFYWVIDNVQISGSGSGQGSVIWSPTTGLYTDAAATTPYTGAAALSVYAKPAVTTTYTTTVTTVAGCPKTNTVAVTVTPAANYYADADGDGYGNLAVTYLGCAQAGYVTNSTDCNDNIAAINPGHAEVLYNGVDDNCDGQLDEGNQLKTKLLPEVCGATLASINSIIGITTLNVNTITMYRIKVVNGASTQIIERNVPHFTLQELAAYDYATTYTISVELQKNGVWLGYYGDTCLVSSPAVLASGGAAQVSPSQCGITLARMNTLVATTSLAGVTGYRFRVTNVTNATGPNVVQTIDRNLNWFSLTMLAQYNYGTTYTVEISVRTNGVYSGFGSPCQVSSPASPTLVNCGGTVATPATLVSCSSLSDITQYRFQITRLSDNSVTTIDRPNNYFTFNMVPGYTPGGQYGVRVAVMTVGTWSPFGDACQITAPGGTARFTAETSAPVSDGFRAAAYPNPFANAFTVDVTASGSENVQLRVYDMTGRLIESRDAKVSELNTQQVGERYPSGVYNVIVTQGENVRTLRVIKR